MINYQKSKFKCIFTLFISVFKELSQNPLSTILNNCLVLFTTMEGRILMRFTVFGVYGSQYFFFLQNGQFFYFSNNNWIPCSIYGLRDITPHNISIDVGKPILVAFADQKFNFYTEPVSQIEITM